MRFIISHFEEDVKYSPRDFHMRQDDKTSFAATDCVTGPKARNHRPRRRRHKAQGRHDQRAPSDDGTRHHLKDDKTSIDRHHSPKDDKTSKVTDRDALDRYAKILCTTPLLDMNEVLRVSKAMYQAMNPNETSEDRICTVHEIVTDNIDMGEDEDLMIWVRHMKEHAKGLCPSSRTCLE